MDIWTKEKRSEVMRRIKGKDTKPEILLRSQLFKRGFRFRVNKKDMPGKPDIVLPKYRSVIFVHGCFWHFHEKCREGRVPSTNSKFWKDKLIRNRNRDKANIMALRKSKWKVFVVWECEIERHLEQTTKSVVAKITC